MKGSIICCKNDSDFYAVQMALFSQGIYWKTPDRGRDSIRKRDKYDSNECALRIRNNQIEAVGESKRYIANDYIHIDCSEYKIIMSDAYLRKAKLERIKRYGNV